MTLEDYIMHLTAEIHELTETIKNIGQTDVNPKVDKVYTAKLAAAALGVCEPMIKRFVAEGVLTPTYSRGKRPVYKESDLRKCYIIKQLKGGIFAQGNNN